MILEHTRLVTREDGCIYCHQPCGEPHKDDCVAFSKVVMVKVQMELPIVVPASWDDYNVDFYLNDSSWCANNIAQDIELLDEADEGNCRCLCNKFHGEYLRDATEDDLDGYTLTKLHQ
jgi:hypothetical protein